MFNYDSDTTHVSVEYFSMIELSSWYIRLNSVTFAVDHSGSSSENKIIICTLAFPLKRTFQFVEHDVNQR